MAIDLSQEVRKQLRASIKRYALENLEQDIGDLKADMLLEYFLKEIGPTVYNQAISEHRPTLRDAWRILRACALRRSSPIGFSPRSRAKRDEFPWAAA